MHDESREATLHARFVLVNITAQAEVKSQADQGQ
jgi:hypothetical protein